MSLVVRGDQFIAIEDLRQSPMMSHMLDALDFPICPDPDDPDACNPYAELQFPDEVYEGIREYREERT
jgi:hypothetical protein